jgi:Septum formation initiator
MKMKFNQFIFFIPVFLLTTYFVFAALNGQYGVFNQIKFMAEKQALYKELADVKSKTKALEHRVKRLSDGFLDLDLLDQQARKYLAVARPNEIIIQIR